MFRLDMAQGAGSLCGRFDSAACAITEASAFAMLLVGRKLAFSAELGMSSTAQDGPNQMHDPPVPSRYEDRQQACLGLP